MDNILRCRTSLVRRCCSSTTSTMHPEDTHPELTEDDIVAEHANDPTGASLLEAVQHPSYGDQLLTVTEEVPEDEKRAGDEAFETGTATPEVASPVGEEKGAPHPEKHHATTTVVLDWDGPDDPENPRNWSFATKWVSAGVTSYYTFIAPLASSLLVRTGHAVGREVLPRRCVGTRVAFNRGRIWSHEPDCHWHVSVNIRLRIRRRSLVPGVRLYLPVSPKPVLILHRPFSEMYGRRWVLHLSNLFFFAFLLACAWAPNITSFIIFRFFGKHLG